MLNIYLYYKPKDLFCQKRFFTLELLRSCFFENTKEKRGDNLKIVWLILAGLTTLLTIEGGFLAFHYGQKVPLVWTMVICVILCVADFIVYFYLADRIQLFLYRWSTIRWWFDKANEISQKKILLQAEKGELTKVEYWTLKFHKMGRWGLLLTSACPHAFPIGIALQKAFKYRYGFWILVLGSISKVIVIAIAILGIEFFISLIFAFFGYN